MKWQVLIIQLLCIFKLKNKEFSYFVFKDKFFIIALNISIKVLNI